MRDVIDIAARGLVALVVCCMGIRAARPETAIPLYNQFLHLLQGSIETPVRTGEFGALMQVKLINDGPVTIVIDSRNKE